ncbi:MICOS complex subunit MIC60, mitochondrial isoform X2 [Typha latifolia]|uniref:MICOS complex subunit MIC60, mitochondrial isoform X2 n=1 Tax=Typha latifolia TaxID=4733 RepID=UPI003C308B98
MFRRCIRDLSLERSFRRIPHPIRKQQMPFFLSSRNEFSNDSQRNSSQRTAPAEEASHSGNYISKIFLGSAVVGAAAMAAYQAGYINLQVKDGKSSVTVSDQAVVKEPENLGSSAQEGAVTIDKQPITLETDTTTIDSGKPHPPTDIEIKKEVASEIAPAEEEPVPVKEHEPEDLTKETFQVPDDQKVDSKLSHENSSEMDRNEPNVEEKMLAETSNEQSVAADDSIIASEQSHAKEASSDHNNMMEMPKETLDTERTADKSLSESYTLQDEESPDLPRKGESADLLAASSSNKEASVTTSENPTDKGPSDDGKFILDLIEAIHAAERKQAESDAYIFSEEKRKLKEKYEKELKDARARELMYAEEAAILDKELKKEKVKSASTIKTLQEKAEQNLREELQRKDEEIDARLEKVQELAKAELFAAIAKEKASQIEKIAEANLNINALCMAFYARSEEASQSHSVHKLALGTLALEEALSKGLPVQAEVDSLCKFLEGIDKDSLLELALSSLPEEVLKHGTGTQMQLKQKFNSLKGTLRHFSLIPAGGGGILAHAVAHVASSIKMKEDQSGDSIESVITRVENLLVDGKLAEAADALEGGVHGSEAEKVVVDWVRQARTRAIADQTLSLLQSYATSITFT